MAKRFFYVSLGLLALMVAFHLGASNVRATSQEIVAGGGSTVSWIVTASGDVFYSWNPQEASEYPWIYGGNVWGTCTATAKTSWGGLKKEFRK